MTSAINPPAPGHLWPNRVTADALQHHVVPMRQEASYCAHPAAQRDILRAIEALQLAIDRLRTEHHS